MVAGDTIYANMLAEQGTEVPDDELTPVGRLRRHFFRGETVTYETAADLGVVAGTISTIVNQLDGCGITVARERHGKPGTAGYYMSYRLADPNIVIDRDKVRAWAGPRSRSGMRDRAEAKTNGTAAVEVAPIVPPPSTGMELPPLPGLGQTVTCVGQVIDTDGNVTLMWRNGQHSWLTTLTGAGPA